MTANPLKKILPKLKNFLKDLDKGVEETLGGDETWLDVLYRWLCVFALIFAFWSCLFSVIQLFL